MMSISPFDGHSSLTPKVQYTGHIPAARVDARAHLEATELPAVQPARHQARRGVVGVLAIAFPVVAARLVVRVRLPLAPRFDDQEAVPDSRVVRLVPLRLFVADKAGLVGPVGAVRAAVDVELVGPDQLVAARNGVAGGGASRTSLGSAHAALTAAGALAVGSRLSADHSGATHCGGEHQGGKRGPGLRHEPRLYRTSPTDLSPPRAGIRAKAAMEGERFRAVAIAVGPATVRSLQDRQPYQVASRCLRPHSGPERRCARADLRAPAATKFAARPPSHEPTS